LFKFLLVKYFGLALTSARALLLAALLGPLSYGILGTLVVAQQSLSYAALGMREGLSVKLAHSHGDAAAALRYSSNALSWAWCIGGLLILLALVLVYGLGVGNVNWVWVSIVSCLSITNEMLININRDRNRLVKVALLDVVFNAAPLAAALLFFHDITVTIALQSLAVGMALSIAFYMVGSRDFSASTVERHALAQLLVLGVPMALLSFVTTMLSSVFVFAANTLHLGPTVGLLVFGNSLCTIALFGLNMAAWAATSTFMKRLHAHSSAHDPSERGAHLVVFFRLGVVAAPAALLGLKLVFGLVLHSYAGSEVYAAHLCVLLSYALLLYTELNFLAVKSRSLVTALGYGVVLLVVTGLTLLVPGVGLMHLLQLAVLMMFVLSVLCIRYCRRLGLVERAVRQQVAFLMFPPLFVGGFALLGTVGAELVALVFVIACLTMYKDDMQALLLRTARATGS
jgi:hypothetical protein